MLYVVGMDVVGLVFRGVSPLGAVFPFVGGFCVVMYGCGFDGVCIQVDIVDCFYDMVKCLQAFVCCLWGMTSCGCTS